MRNVHFYDTPRPSEPLGGLYLNPSVTKKKFLRMLESLVRTNGLYSIWLRGNEVPLAATDDPVDLTNVVLGTIWLTDERCIARSFSRTVSRRDRRFREQVRSRDGKCLRGYSYFPLAHEDLFICLNFPQYVTNRSEGADTGVSSCQNGLLMRSHIHKQFDSFSFAIDPDDNYRITCFNEDLDGGDGRSLDPVCRNPEDEGRVAVLANMKGNFEPIFESDFPDESDMMGEILSGPRAAERMEAELFSRLNSISPIP
ncbi:hypothetical protein V1521DRAFT_463486 [Lipomyces starkeyi]